VDWIIICIIFSICVFKNQAQNETGTEGCMGFLDLHRDPLVAVAVIFRRRRLGKEVAGHGQGKFYIDLKIFSSSPRHRGKRWLDAGKNFLPVSVPPSFPTAFS